MNATLCSESCMVTTGQEMVRGKNFFKVGEKSGNFTSSQGKFLKVFERSQGKLKF